MPPAHVHAHAHDDSHDHGAHGHHHGVAPHPPQPEGCSILALGMPVRLLAALAVSAALWALVWAVTR